MAVLRPRPAPFIIVVRSMVAFRHTWCWRSSWELYIWIHRQQEERERHWGFRNPISHLQLHFFHKTTPTPTRPRLLILSNSATPWRLSIQIYEPMWVILIQTIVLMQYLLLNPKLIDAILLFKLKLSCLRDPRFYLLSTKITGSAQSPNFQKYTLKKCSYCCPDMKHINIYYIPITWTLRKYMLIIHTNTLQNI